MAESQKNFWQTDKGKAFNHAIHEHNTGLGNCRTYLSLLEEDVLEVIDDPIRKHIKGIREGLKKQQEAMDYLYTKIKELEGY